MAHDQEVVGSNPSTVYWMDVSDASYYITPKITKIKVAEWGTPKKYKKNGYWKAKWILVGNIDPFLKYLRYNKFPTSRFATTVYLRAKQLTHLFIYNSDKKKPLSVS